MYCLYWGGKGNESPWQVSQMVASLTAIDDAVADMSGSVYCLCVLRNVITPMKGTIPNQILGDIDASGIKCMSIKSK